MQKKNNKSKLHPASIFSLFFPTNSPYLTPIGSDKSSNQFSESESGSDSDVDLGGEQVAESNQQEDQQVEQVEHCGDEKEEPPRSSVSAEIRAYP